MSDRKSYTCICREIFDKPQSFNAHKSGCRVHLLNKYGNLDNYTEHRKRVSDKISISMKQYRENQKQDKLSQWVSEQHRCERCGKIMTEYYASGRFCNKQCANARPQSAEVREHISEGVKSADMVIRRDIIYHCKYCDFTNNYLNGMAVHERYCKKNPNGLSRRDLDKYMNNFIVTRYGDVLNITKYQLDSYRANHTCCEICGRSIEDINSTYKHIRNLCMDHDHNTNQFRGVLCQACNRQLGWYEKNAEAIRRYLDRPNPTF